MLFAFLQRTLIFSSLHSFRLTENCGNSTKSSQLNSPTTSPNHLRVAVVLVMSAIAEGFSREEHMHLVGFQCILFHRPSLMFGSLTFFFFFEVTRCLSYAMSLNLCLVFPHDSNYAFLEKVLLCPFQMT